MDSIQIWHFDDAPAKYRAYSNYTEGADFVMLVSVHFMDQRLVESILRYKDFFNGGRIYGLTLPGGDSLFIGAQP